MPKISELPAFSGTINGSENLPIVFGSTTYRVSFQQIIDDKQLGLAGPEGPQDQLVQQGLKVRKELLAQQVQQERGLKDPIGLTGPEKQGPIGLTGINHWDRKVPSWIDWSARSNWLTGSY